MIAKTPEEPVDIPRIVTQWAAGRTVQAFWRNELGGLTFQIGHGDTRQFVKWAPAEIGIELTDEITRLDWAAHFTAVPHVIDSGSDQHGSWIVTNGLPGRSAVDDTWKRDPATAVRAIGTGLRALHDALPVAQCPFDWSAQTRLATAQARTDPATWPLDLGYPGGHVTSFADALDLLTDIPPVDQLVVCHGDACAPNTLIGDDGTCTGHVDLGTMGLADRWADLAVATWSTHWNYGPGWEPLLLNAYGIAPDQRRISYYRLLWELAD